MITLRDARLAVLEAAGGPLESDRIPVSASAGRVLAGSVVAGGDLPPFDRVMMDGFAVRARDTAAGEVLTVTAEVAAGDPADAVLGRGEAHEIMTGAPLPEGADAVVPVEQTEREAGRVRLLRAVQSGQHVAPRGQDRRAGDTLAKAGGTITGMSLSLLVSSGVAEVDVVRRPAVALLTSGNELVVPGAPVRRGQIHESNGAALETLFTACGAEVHNLGIARDTTEALRDRVQRALTKADVVVITGGSSVGRYDFTARVVASLGGEQLFERIAVKPGKPTLLFTVGDKLVFGLPGNPVAAVMTGRVLVCAALAALQGKPVHPWATLQLPLGNAVRRHPERDLMLPVRHEGAGVVFDGWHGSGDLACLSRADGFACVARGEGAAHEGSLVDVFAVAREPAW